MHSCRTFALGEEVCAQTDLAPQQPGTSSQVVHAETPTEDKGIMNE